MAASQEVATSGDIMCANVTVASDVHSFCRCDLLRHTCRPTREREWSDVVVQKETMKVFTFLIVSI